MSGSLVNWFWIDITFCLQESVKELPVAISDVFAILGLCSMWERVGGGGGVKSLKILVIVNSLTEFVCHKIFGSIFMCVCFSTKCGAVRDSIFMCVCVFH